MTEEYIELLATDISARVKHGVQVMLIENEETMERYKLYLKPYPLKPMTVIAFINYDVSGSKYKLNLDGDIVRLEDCKPYLRPMSDMSEEEEDLLTEFNCYYTNGKLFFSCGHTQEDVYNAIDWLNKKGFDYRGLIEKGLAIALYFNVPKE